MPSKWVEEERIRPDPYIDWGVRAVSAAYPSKWSPVVIELAGETDAARSDNLRVLLTMVREGCCAMLDEEHAHATALLNRLTDGPARSGPIRLFVYLAEEKIFEEGRFAAFAAFRIESAGPAFEVVQPEPSAQRISPREGDVSLFRKPAKPVSGEVAIGILDDGIAFAHPRFGSGNRQTRIQAIWIQELAGRTGKAGPEFGRMIGKATIDADLAAGLSEAAIYRKHGALDFRQAGHKPLAARLSHGTHVLDLAAGAPPGREIANRPIFAVQLPPEATADTSGTTMGSFVLQGMRQIMHWADLYRPGIPLVINFSYGMFAGPKDGSHPLERAMAALVNERNTAGAPTILVLPSGNNYQTRTTAAFTLDHGQEETLDWRLPPDDRTPSYVEFWIDPEATNMVAEPVLVSIVVAAETRPLTMKPQVGKVHVLRRNGHAVAGLYAERHGDRLRLVLAVNGTARHDLEAAPAPAGTWALTIENAGSTAITVHAYVQRDDTPSGYPLRGRQSLFDHPHAHGRDALTGRYDRFEKDCPLTLEETLSAIATGTDTIVVGAAVESAGIAPASYTSSGPSPGRAQPDCSAIADQGIRHWGILAAGTWGGTVAAMRGTSVAAPQVARKIADALASGKTAGDRSGLLECISRKAIPAGESMLPRLGAFTIGLESSLATIRRIYRE